MTDMNPRRGPSPLVIAVEEMSFFRRDVKAACSYHDPELWFSRSDEHEWKKICRYCPLRLGCAEWGVDNEKDGVWGGLTENERKRIRKARERAAA